ncbi:mitochondrial K+-H+ exchange-related-domain-containing protein [Daedaleopsis nitida]|nr:mitochondrial K+-H+ exchange-related-domain-containing protein [Daedaleopsis nitida]
MLAPRVVRSATRSMRVIALPLTSQYRVDGKLVEPLTYYHFVTPPEDKKANTWMNWGAAKASDMWANLGKAPEGNWKRRAFLYGERLVDRLDFEELALKSLDPSLGPRLSNIVPHGSNYSFSPVIPLVYPPSVCMSPVPDFDSLLEKRTPRHTKGFWFWLAVTPLTAPLKLIPIIPNFPFFFCVWRSWSHYRAYKASQYLEGFLHRGAIVSEASAALDAIYARYAPPLVSQPERSSEPASTASHLSDSDMGSSTRTPGARLLLTKDAVPELVKVLELSEESTFAADMYRALEQARMRPEGRNSIA